MSSPVYLGLDFGTSGARACVMAPNGEIEEMAQVAFGELPLEEAAATWREALYGLIAGLPSGQRKRLAALAIDGTSATVLACDEALNVTYPPLMYNDARATTEAAAIRRAAGWAHPAAMPTSGLAKVLWLKRTLGLQRARLYLNQADWLSALLSGRPVSDFHNALKMGYEFASPGDAPGDHPNPQSGAWPAWVEYLADVDYLPIPMRPGAGVGLISHHQARSLGVNTDCLIRAGTTDSIAAFLATGATQPGHAVTSLGTTLVLKLLSTTRVDDANLGVYSHWFGNLWLTGGASNAGGGILKQYFSDAELAEYSARIDPQHQTGLDYYPLPAVGERFPVNDPDLAPRLLPVPENRITFLHGLLEGLARIEAQGYRQLAALGASPLTYLTSMGGGADNPAYSHIRARALGIPVCDDLTSQTSNAVLTLNATDLSKSPSAPVTLQACYGTARLACFGPRLFPGEQDG